MENMNYGIKPIPLMSIIMIVKLGYILRRLYGIEMLLLFGLK